MDAHSDLMCPISLDLFEDPISVPCCGQTFSRAALMQHLSNRGQCPMCRGDLSRFDADRAPRNVAIARMAESAREPQQAPAEQTAHATACHIHGDMLLSIIVQNISTTARPVLFIAVCDASGSMSGNPWRQVDAAVQHMVSVARTSAAVELGVVVYSSDARMIHVDHTVNRISLPFVGGGTNFSAAFQELGAVLRSKQNGVYGEAIVAFLTDGQACGTRNRLKDELNKALSSWSKPITVHTVGFGGGCDIELLELLRQCGSKPGTFRYAAPEDSIDALCSKITELFDYAESARCVDMLINDRPAELKIVDGAGRAAVWCPTTEYGKKSPITVSLGEHKWTIEPTPIEPDRETYAAWLRKCTDDVAGDIIDLANRSSTDLVGIGVLRQRVQRMQAEGATGLELAEDQLRALAENQLIDVRRLRDLQHSSKFAHSGAKGRDLERHAQPAPTPRPIGAPIEFPVQYASFDSSRPALHRAIMKSPPGRAYCHGRTNAGDIEPHELVQLDGDGNTALHLAAYMGQFKTVMLLCQLGAPHEPNSTGETPATLAIKSRGHTKTLSALLDVFGPACVPHNRVAGLVRYCIDRGYTRTAAILGDMGDTALTEITVENARGMTIQYIRHMYSTFEQNAQFASTFILAAIERGPELFDIAHKALARADQASLSAITPEVLFAHCFPRKADALDIPEYLGILTALLDACPDFLSKCTAGGDTLLHQAVEKGSLPHVQELIRRGIPIDSRNALGNTPLWLACAKRYPCIVDELLAQGADPNAPNNKGNPPLYSTCQVGPARIAEALVHHGADVETVNGNGDTLILICCRNGQHAVLEVLLRYVDLAFVNRVAHIDGFNAVFAATEADRPECLELLLAFGVDFSQRTAADNEILADATPLHLAAYYNRLKAAEVLLRVADVDARTTTCGADDTSSFTPLQIAVIFDNTDMIPLLIAAGANRAAGLKYCHPNSRAAHLLQDPLVIIPGRAADLAKFWHPYWNSADIAVDSDGMTPLMLAVLDRRADDAVALVELGASMGAQNAHGASAMVYAMLMRNKRLIERVAAAATESCSATERDHAAVAHILKDCTALVAGLDGAAVPVDRFGDRMRIHAAPRSTENAMVSAALVHRTLASVDKVAAARARLDVVNEVIAAGSFEPAELAQWPMRLVVAVYRRTYIDDAAQRGVFNALLMQSLCLYPEYAGEVFVQAGVSRELTVGDTIDATEPFSGSTLWKLAADGLDTKRGTVLVVQPLSESGHSPIARFVGGPKSEAVLPPGQYSIVAEYHYDPICLGQQNIRPTTFAIKAGDHVKAKVYVVQKNEGSFAPPDGDAHISL